ncbi:MAG: dienelactone hydrolase family protein [Planctomycetes bacterium]|nr:dienelactone hydrolase family protein [Planctomycetota bacterium]
MADEIFNFRFVRILAPILSAAMISLVLADEPASRPDGPSTAPASRPASAPASQPQTPGNHRLFFNTKPDGADRRMAYAVWLPKAYQEPKEKFPMVVFLLGAGEVGNNHDGIYVHGPPAELLRNPKLAEKSNYIVLSPQCPAGKRWESEGLAQAVLDLIEYVCKTWRVDRDRIYLTGLSMGGKGTWLIAEKSNGLFAAIAPISADEYDPGKIADTLKGTTVWIIIGGNDQGYTAGSQKMRDLLRQNKIDVVYTEIPGMGHGAWSSFYCSQRFYDFLLLHAKGRPPPADRPDEKSLLSIGYTPPESVDARLAGQFKKFLPYWQLLNCGPDMDPGLKDEIRGRKNVFVTHPLDQATPCRIISTLSIPAGKKSALKLVVGHHDDGDWDLVVRADGKEIRKKSVGKETAKDGWLELKVNLDEYAGKSIFVELLNRSSGWHCEAAYWGKVELVSEDVPAQTRPAAPAAGR